jgi:DNA replication and repair protein RecF
MHLKSLHLRAFRNYSEQQLDFQAPKTILVGDNAQGKSNLLEAVELLSSLKSHRTSRDRDLVLEGATAAMITAQLDRRYGPAELRLRLPVTGRRGYQVNQETVRRQADFLGVLNAVQFSCLDLELVRGGPDSRRQWLDTLLIQLEPLYAHILTQYQQVLKQRNSLLKQARQGQVIDPIALTLWDQQLAEFGTHISRRRARALSRLIPLAQDWHQRISGHQEKLEIIYQPNVPWQADDPATIQQAFLAKFSQRRIAEQQLGTSVVGPHRDEIVLTINQTPAKAYGSQGQQRTLVLALKLAELHLLETIIGEPPLLLLDDVLAELDLHRQGQLLAAIEDRFQTLITTTHLNRFEPHWLGSAEIYQVQQGQLTPLALAR